MGLSSKHLYEFGPFVLDADERVLLREGQPVSLAPKAFDTLLALSSLLPWWRRCSRLVISAMKHLGKTSPFCGPKGETLPGSIAEFGYLRLGGLD